MPPTYQRWKSRTEQPRKKRASNFGAFPWGLVLLAMVPLGLLTFYTTVIAPERLDVLKDLEVPFPAATEFLARACDWCGKNMGKVVVIALGLLAVGVFLPVPPRGYYIGLAIATTLTLGFTYYSISAPVELLLKRVKDSLPEERKVPDFLPGGKPR